MQVDTSECDPTSGEYDEHYKRGSISYKIFYDYFSSSWSILNGFLILSLFAMAQFFMNLSDYYVSTWADSENNLNMSFLLETNNSNATQQLARFQETRSHKYKNYSIFVGVFGALIFLRSISYYISCVRSSFVYHRLILNAVMSTKSRFFDLNPVGRIMNRFSKVNRVSRITVFII
jgi:ATP-binding cassette subfamily C (CFTR/MRP) protein 4